MILLLPGATAAARHCKVAGTWLGLGNTAWDRGAAHHCGSLGVLHPAPSTELPAVPLDPRGAGTPCPQVLGCWSRGCSLVPCTGPEIHLVLFTVSLPPIPWLPLGAHLGVQAPAVKLQGTGGEAGLWLAGSSSKPLTSPWIPCTVL